MFHVIAFPPPRPWWAFWRASRPFLLLAGLECRIDPSGETAEVFRPRRGWQYKVAFVAA